MAAEQEKDASSRDKKRQRSVRKNGGARGWSTAHGKIQAMRDLIDSYAPKMRVWAKLSSGIWWPGYVPNMEDLPKSLLKHKRVGWTCVCLYGSDNTLTCPEFVWLQAKSLLEYGKNLDELSEQAIMEFTAVDNFKAALAGAQGCPCSDPEDDAKAKMKVIAKFKRVAKKKLAKKSASIPCLNFSSNLFYGLSRQPSNEVHSLQEITDSTKEVRDRNHVPSRKRKRHERHSKKQGRKDVAEKKSGHENDVVTDSLVKTRAERVSGCVFQGKNTHHGRNDVPNKMGKQKRKKTGDDGSYFECMICDTGGNLLCCDLCPRVYHLGCLDPPLKRTPPGKWNCPICRGDAGISKPLGNRLLGLKFHITLRSSEDSRKLSASKCVGDKSKLKKHDKGQQDVQVSSPKKLRKRSREEDTKNLEKKVKVKPDDDAACGKEYLNCLSCHTTELSSSISSKLSSCKECAKEVLHADLSVEISNQQAYVNQHKVPILEPSHCEICGETGILISCERCLRIFHSTCVTPSAKRTSKSSLVCPMCMPQGNRQSDELHQIGYTDTSHEVERIVGCRLQATRHLLQPSTRQDTDVSEQDVLNQKQERPCPGSSVFTSVERTPVDEAKSCLETEGSKCQTRDTISNEVNEHDRTFKPVQQDPSKRIVIQSLVELANDMTIISSMKQPGEDEIMSLKGATSCTNIAEEDLSTCSLAKDCAIDKDTRFPCFQKKPFIGGEKAKLIAEAAIIGLSENVLESESLALSSKPLIETGLPFADTSFRANSVKLMQEFPSKSIGVGDTLVRHEEAHSSLEKNILAVVDSNPIDHSIVAEVLEEAISVRKIGCNGSEESVFEESLKPSQTEEPSSELEYLVKWSGRSHIHNEWLTEAQLRSLAKRKLDNFKAKYGTVPIILLEQKWCEPQRIIARRQNPFSVEEALVKWSGLPYDECTWEILTEPVISKNSQLLSAYNKFEETVQKLEADISKSLLRPDLVLDRSTQVEIEAVIEQPKELAGGLLFPHQIEALNWLRKCWQRRKNVILADEMGLGKTISASAFISSLYNEFKAKAPCLVLVPLSTMLNWLAELSAWAPDLNVIEYHGSSKARAVIRQFEWYTANEEWGKKRRALKFNVLLTTYEMVIADPGPLRSVPWEALIVDEGHRLKNSGSKLFHLLNTFSFSHRVLLTGTPLQNNLGELYNLLNFLQPDSFPSLAAFQDKFSALSTAEQVDEIRNLVAPHILRRLKKDTMQEIPPKRERVVPVELTAVQAEYYCALLTRNFQLLRRGAKGGHQQSMLNIIMELRKVCNHPYLIPGTDPEFGTSHCLQEMRIKASGKLTLLHSMLVNLKDQGHRVLIFSQMTKLLDILEDYLTFQFGHDAYERVDGSVPVAERQAAIARFNKDQSRFFFLLSTRACGLGINLATADTVIIYDSDFNPHADIQAMNRAHRIGQSKKLLVYRLVVRASVEERILQLAKKKLMLDHLFASKSGSQKEIEDILQWGTEELFHESSGKPQEQINIEQNGSSSSALETTDDMETHKRKRVGGLGDVYDDKCHRADHRKVMWDDVAVARLLDRSAISSGTDEGVDGETDNDMLGSLKVWDWNDQETDEKEAAEPLGMDNKGLPNGEQKSGSEEDNKWEKLLRTRWEKFQREEEEALGRGKRQRKVVSYNECLGKNALEVSGESEEQVGEPEPEYTPAGQALKQKLAKLRARQKERIALRQIEFVSVESNSKGMHFSCPIISAGTFTENQVHPKSLLRGFEDMTNLPGSVLPSVEDTRKLPGNIGTEAALGPDSAAGSMSEAMLIFDFGAGKEASAHSCSASLLQREKYEEIPFMGSRNNVEKPSIDYLSCLDSYFSPNRISFLSNAPSVSYDPPESVAHTSRLTSVPPFIVTKSTVLDDQNRIEASIGGTSVFEVTSSINTSSSGNGLGNFLSGLTDLSKMHFASGFGPQGLPVHYDNPSRSLLHSPFSKLQSYGTQPKPSSDIGSSVRLQTSLFEGKSAKITVNVEPKVDHTSIPSFSVDFQELQQQPQINNNTEFGSALTAISSITKLEAAPNQTKARNGQAECFRKNQIETQAELPENIESAPLPFLPSISSTSRDIEDLFRYSKLSPLMMSLGSGGAHLDNQWHQIGLSGLNSYSGGNMGISALNPQSKPLTLPFDFPSKNLNISFLTKESSSKAPSRDLIPEPDASIAGVYSSRLQKVPSTLQSSNNLTTNTNNVNIWSLLDSKKDMFCAADKIQCRDQLSWSEEELDALWAGVRRHGRGNWLSMLQDPRLRFSNYRTVKDLSERWNEEQQKLFGGQDNDSSQIAAESTLLSNNKASGRMPMPLFGGAFTDTNGIQGTFGKAEDRLGSSKLSCLSVEADTNFLAKGPPYKESFGKDIREPFHYPSLHLDRADIQERVLDLRHVSSFTSKSAIPFPLSDKGERVSMFGTTAAYENTLSSTSKHLGKYAGTNSQTRKARKSCVSQEVGSASRNLLPGLNLSPLSNVEGSYNSIFGEGAARNGNAFDPFTQMWKNSDLKLKLGRKKPTMPPWGKSEVTTQPKPLFPSYERFLPKFSDIPAVPSFPNLSTDFCLNSKKSAEIDIETKKQLKSYPPPPSPGQQYSLPVDSIMNTSKKKLYSMSDTNVVTSSNLPSTSSATHKGSSSCNLPHWLKEVFNVVPPVPALSPQVAAVAQAVAMLHRGQNSLLPPWLHPWHPLLPPKDLPKRKKKKRNRKLNGRPGGTELECSEELSGGANLSNAKTHSRIQSCPDLSADLKIVKTSRNFSLPSVPGLPLIHKLPSPSLKVTESTTFSNQLEPMIGKMGVKQLPMSIASASLIHKESRQLNLSGGQGNVCEQSFELLKSTKPELPQWLLSTASGACGPEVNCITLTSDLVPAEESSSETHSDPDIRSKCSDNEFCQEVSSDETISDHE